MSGKGRFIVFEGLDGCGKTTQLFNLRRKLQEYGVICREEREPSDGIVGLVTRGAVKKKFEFRQETLALLFAADRLEHVVNDIVPDLENGRSVLCDRFVYSSMAYQSLYLPVETVALYNKTATDMLVPDLTLFIDVPPSVCARRILNERAHSELYEDERQMEAVRGGFEKAFELLPGNVKIIDGNKKEGLVFDRVWDAARTLFDEL